MNIALFSDSYLPTKSGIVTVVIQLKRILEELGHKVVIVTVSNHHALDEDFEEDEDILRVKSIHSFVGDDQYIGIPIRHKVVEFLEKHEVRLIHAHTEFFIGQMAVIAGKKIGIPVIATTHTMWEDYYRHYFTMGAIVPKSVVRQIVRQLYKKFYALINVSEKAKNYFTQPKMLPSKPCAVIPNAIDTEKFISHEWTAEEKAALRSEYHIAPTDKIMLYVGRVVEEKRVEEMLEVVIRAVRANEGVKMLFVGAGGALYDLEERVKKEGLADKIIFTGFVDWFKVSSLYSIADVFITTSLSEMHSMTILEALSLGVPVVCRADTSFSDTIFQGEDGFMADTDEEMDGYIQKVLGDSALHDAMSKKAREVAGRFTLRLHGLRTVAFYEEVLKHYPYKIKSADLDAAVQAIEA
ncbi:MAG: glycosyltransferase [Spirochaetaceae bacterium]|nr:glycosyltransferase [Spirochaetaceae bacterium]